MIFATTLRRNRHTVSALSLLATIVIATGCSSNDGTTGSGGAGGATGGAGGATGGSGGATGGSGGTGGATGGAGGATGGAGGATGGAGGSTGGTGGTAGADAGTGLHGSFVIKLVSEPEPAFTDFLGRVYGGPQPPSLVLVRDSVEGACELLVPKSPFCRPACTGGVCVDDNTCMPSPALVGIGTISVKGLKGGDLMIPEPQTKNYQVIPTLAANACDEGGTIEIGSAKLSLAGKCVAQLKLAAGPMDKIAVKSGSPVKVVWDPPAQAGISRIYIHLDIAHHGGKKGEINCDVPDNGSFDIPTALTAKLISLGLAGFPTIDVTRYHASPSAAEPNVKIEINSSLTREVDTGVKSCSDDTECTPPEKCQADKTCK
jgi:hypothetical protein